MPCATRERNDGSQYVNCWDMGGGRSQAPVPAVNEYGIDDEIAELMRIDDEINPAGMDIPGPGPVPEGPRRDAGGPPVGRDEFERARAGLQALRPDIDFAEYHNRVFNLFDPANRSPRRPRTPPPRQPAPQLYGGDQLGGLDFDMAEEGVPPEPVGPAEGVPPEAPDWLAQIHDAAGGIAPAEGVPPPPTHLVERPRHFRRWLEDTVPEGSIAIFDNRVPRSQPRPYSIVPKAEALLKVHKKSFRDRINNAPAGHTQELEHHTSDPHILAMFGL